MGVVKLTSAVDWGTFVWSPEAAVDLATEPGTVMLATGYATVTGTGPGWQHPNYAAAGDWGELLAFIALEEGLRFWARFCCAANQAGLAAATWTPYYSAVDLYTPDLVEDPDLVGVTHRLRVDVGTEVLNGEIADAGPWFNLQVMLRR